MDYNGFLHIVQTIVVLIGVIALANIILRSMGKQMNKQNKMIKILERVSVNNNSSINIVEICGSYYLMSFTSNDNKILKELPKEEVASIIREKEKDLEQMSQKAKAFTQQKGKIFERFKVRKKID